MSMDSSGVMAALARWQNMELSDEMTVVGDYRLRIAQVKARDAKRLNSLTEEKNKNMELAQAFSGGFENIEAALDDIERADRLKKSAYQTHKHDKEQLEHEEAEDSQVNKEIHLHISNAQTKNTSSPPLGQITATTQADLKALRDIFNEVAKRGNDKDMDLRDRTAILSKAIPVVQRLMHENPALKSNPIFASISPVLSSFQRIAGSSSECQTELQSLASNEAPKRACAGDWARYFKRTASLGPETILSLARGLTRPVDARNPGDWMSLFWEVALSADTSSIIRHDINKGLDEVISELDRASEIFALSYRHRVHGNQANGLRYRLQECCWADLRTVFEGAVATRPHGRVVLWWDQVLGATNRAAATLQAWATVGLLPYTVFRVVYNPPTRCPKHNPVYQGRDDFEAPSDNKDLHRLWINLEHRLALRGRGLLMSRRVGANGCLLWNLEKTGSAWDGDLIREIQGDECVPMSGIRRIVSHLLREKLGDMLTTVPADIVQLQQWAATLATLPRKDRPFFLAGRVRGRQKLTVTDVIRIVLEAGAPTTLDGGGPLLPSAPTVESPRTSENRAWSGVREWAPLLMENALEGWMEADVEKTSREELEKFTIWVVFPIETDSQISEAVAIGKLWTPVQAVSSYMLVWLELPTSSHTWNAQESSPDNFLRGSPVYGESQVRMTQLVWPQEVNSFHETFCGVHWAHLSLKTCSDEKVEYPMGLCSILHFPEPQANRALQSSRVPADMLFSCMVDEWGPTMMKHFAGKPILESASNQAGLRPAPGVPIGVMSGEEVCWDRQRRHIGDGALETTSTTAQTALVAENNHDLRSNPGSSGIMENPGLDSSHSG